MLRDQFHNFYYILKASDVSQKNEVQDLFQDVIVNIKEAEENLKFNSRRD